MTRTETLQRLQTIYEKGAKRSVKASFCVKIVPLSSRRRRARGNRTAYDGRGNRLHHIRTDAGLPKNQRQASENGNDCHQLWATPPLANDWNAVHTILYKVILNSIADARRKMDGRKTITMSARYVHLDTPPSERHRVLNKTR
jgi:hypothetical protein